MSIMSRKSSFKQHDTEAVGSMESDENSNDNVIESNEDSPSGSSTDNDGSNEDGDDSDDDSKNDTSMSEEGEEASDENSLDLDNDIDSKDKAIKGNPGWADSIAKILKSKKPKGKKMLVLSKAKKYVEKEKKDIVTGFDVIGEDGKVKNSIEEETIENDEPKPKKRRELHPDLRLKPNILDRERERLLSKTATRGVVQLFNAVRNQQKDLEKRIEDAGPVERKKDKIIKSLDKNKFLDSLMGKSKSENVNRVLEVKKELKKEDVKEEKSKWNVFREDFMMGAKMKDWDKKEDDDENVSEMNDTDSD